jgi:hypothetical protein
VRYLQWNCSQHADSCPSTSHIYKVSTNKLVHPLSPLGWSPEGWVTLDYPDRKLLFKLPVDMDTNWKWLAHGSRIAFGTRAGKMIAIECGNILSAITK